MAIKAPKRTWYQSDPEAIEEALADLGGGNFFKAKDGKNIVRILPPYKDNGKFFYEGKFHYGFKLDGKNITIPYTGEDSFIMKKLNALASEGEESSKLSRRYGPRTKYFGNIIDRESGTVKIWGFSKKIMQTLKAFRFDEEDGGAFEDPDEGHDVIIERTGKGMETRYDVRFRPRPTPAIEAGAEVPELFDLEAEAAKEFTVQELKAAWNETMNGAPEKDVARGENTDVEDDEDEPVVKKSKKQVEEEDDDDDEEDEPVIKKSKKAVVEEDDEDEEEAPVVTRKKKVVEEEDEEEEAPVVRKRKKVVEEEEEEAPVTRTRRVRR